MTDKELNKILGIVQSNYLNHFKLLDNFSGNMIFETWKYFFKSWPYEIVFKAIMEYISTDNPHPPKTGQINKILYSYINIDNNTPEKSFEKITNFANRFGYTNVDLDKFNLTQIEKRIITKGYLKSLGISSSEVSYLRHAYVQEYNRVHDQIVNTEMLQLPNMQEEEILKLIDKKQFLLE